ncbi:anti-sigma factor antagonist [Streptomyces sp. NPDC046860]|uniref:anti-sigma factor antagonist n=1 Tax=Streptomyces sp. NPDC046860 TaxID=3154495 RepID=UPI0033DE8554
MREEAGPPTRHLRVREERGHTVLELRGEIDIASAAKISPLLDRLTGREHARVVLDLRPVEFFDCSGLRLVNRARHRVLERGGRLQLVCVHPLTLRVLAVTGLTAVLPAHPTLEAALRAMGGDRER